MREKVTVLLAVLGLSLMFCAATEAGWSKAASKDATGELSAAKGISFSTESRSNENRARKGKKRKKRKTGRLEVLVGGLPKGSPARVVIRGPKLGKKSKGRFIRKIRKVGRVVIRRAPVGKYRIKISPVTMTRGIGTIKKGARAEPVVRVRKLRVKRGGGKRVKLLYGTVINPGVVSLGLPIVGVKGNPDLPESIVVGGSGENLAGKIVSAAPSPQVPHGILAHVVEVRPAPEGSELVLSPADMFEAVPNISLNSSLTTTQDLTRAALSCGVGASAGVTPYANVESVKLSGGWVTTKVLFATIPTGADVKVKVGLAAGVRISAEAAASCSIDLPGIAVQGMAGPVPVYGKLAPGAKAGVSASASIDAEARMVVVLGAKVNTAPVEAKPHFKVEKPTFNLDIQGTPAKVTAGVSLGLELGIGVSDLGNINLKLGNDLNYTMDRDGCRWDLYLGSFSAGGKVGPVGFSTSLSDGRHVPISNDSSCGGWGAPVDPPQLRSKVSWNTDADVDLHVWDEWGNHTYFSDQGAIYDSFLVTDVIPDYGDFGLHAEEFYESGDFGRAYTVGICLFAGEDADVEVEVTDPGGETRTFNTYLDPYSYGELITVSPEGADVYDPGWDDWCYGPDD